MPMVSVRRAPSYDDRLMDETVAAHFEALGVEKDLSPEMRVLLKPNLLAGRAPALAVTTHPGLLGAVARWLRARGIRDIVLADSPGGVSAKGIRRLRPQRPFAARYPQRGCFFRRTRRLHAHPPGAGSGLYY